ncbi:zinc-binding dehydrogenase [uncultured Methanobrevibacter sp.]|uniref:zinc-binding dehydrogenase n=1 Tax=uncultured Methanobrevibacter sp. TaxID=253161 RepID=UPI0025F30290|nr:zinc-binding dehydrogenase [uncultured Methanobrevibacter sp.]
MTKWLKKKNQKYYFIFVQENGQQLRKISEILDSNKIDASVDEIYNLDDINEALRKVDGGGSKGKTLIKIN